MVGSYTLQIEAFGVYTANMPSLEIWEDGVLNSTHAISAAGSSFSVTINYGGALPTSLALTFNDGFAAAGRTIEIRSVRIDNQHVNVGNYLSTDSLAKSTTATVDVAGPVFLFDATDPALSEFTTGATRTMTAGNDTMRDFSGTTDEIFDALGGRDVLYLGSGNDKVFGNDGDDIIYAGGGNDLISGGNGADNIYGGLGNDRLYGGDGNDRIHGEGGDDEIYGGAGDDTLNGHAGADTIVGGAGADKINGGDDNDILYGGADDDQIVGGNGNDTIDGGDGDDLVYGGAGIDHIDGGAGADILIGNDGADVINGGGDNDTIYLANGDFAAGEEIYGGAGTDELILRNAMTIDFTTGAIDQIETLTGSDADQDVTYSIQQALQFTTIDLNGGNDTSRVNISGTVDVTALGTPTVTDVENGFVTGSAGIDTLTISGAQLDALVFGAGTVDFGASADVLNLTSTSANLNTLGSTLNASIIGLETISANSAIASVTINMSAQSEGFTLLGGSAVDTLTGGAGADVIVGGAGADTITGGAGNDTLHGHGLTDTEIQNILTANPTAVYNQQSNSFYRYVATNVNYTTAEAAATSSTLTGIPGLNGHLANITSAAESTYLYNYGRTSLGTDFIWIGGSDRGNEGVWTWQGGVEAGTQFWSGNQTGSTVNNQYANFLSNNPQGGAAENVSVIITNSGTPAQNTFWADQTETSTNYYFIEWDAGLINDDNAIDTLNGGAGNDFLYGYGGDDILNGDADNDALFGGAGNDTLNGGTGNDALYGQEGNDTLNGGTGADTINGGSGNDTINLANGDFAAGESLIGGADTDNITLTNATTVNFTAGLINAVENLIGSAGNDDVTYTIQQALAFTSINLGGGTDASRVQISGAVDVTLLGTPTVTSTENGFVTGSAGADTLTISGAQLDSLIFGTGTIDLSGGADVLNLTSTSVDLNTLGATNASIAGLETISASTAAAGVIINLTGQTEGFTITGSNNADIITGGTGADIINGGNGNDTINLANGHFVAGESLTGGADTDNITLTNATTVNFTTGTLSTIETLNGSTGNDNVTIGAAQLAGFTAINLLGGTDSLTTILSGTSDISALSLPTVSNVETGSVVGSAGVDVLTATGAQIDAMIQGVGTINFNGGADVLNITSTSADLNNLGSTSNAGVQGLETISASTAGAGVIINMSAQTEAFTLTGSSSGDSIIGGSAIDTINGGNGADILTGLGGNDIINGGDGNDTILGGNGNDTLTGGNGNDTIYGATIIGESGVESAIQSSAGLWHSVSFSASILNPVVKMTILTNNDGDPYTVRVRDVTETGFQWQIDEWDYLDGTRAVAETVSWLAIASGTHTLDNGLVVQAGTTTATNENYTNVTFNAAFGSAPVVMSQIMSDNDSAAVGGRNRTVTATGFQTSMLEEENANGIHSTEKIGWIAIDNGGSVGSGFLVDQTGSTVSESTTTVTFPSTFANVPVVIYDMQTVNGGDTAVVGGNGVTTSSVSFHIAEEQSRDAELNHGGLESVGYFALNEGLLTSAGGGNNTLSGGAGLDTLYGGDGVDTFIFEAASAFINRDIVADFSAGEGDILDISDIIVGAFSGTITDYVNFDDSSGTHTIVQIDANGLTGGSSFSDIAQINGITGLDEATLYANGNIVV